MSILAAWAATHTGLPSFHLSGPGTLRAGDRVVATLKAGDARLVSDAGAPCGVPVTYLFGAESATLERLFLGEHRENVMVTDESGRGVANAIWENTKDSVSWEGDGFRHETGALRFSSHPSPVEGESAISLLDLSKQAEFERVLREHGRVWIVPSSPTPGIPRARLLFVKKITRSRITVSGILRYTISWSKEDPLTVSPAPVVTWGEWEDWGKESGNPSGWQDWSEVDLAQRISGMPTS